MYVIVAIYRCARLCVCVRVCVHIFFLLIDSVLLTLVFIVYTLYVDDDPY